MAESGQQAHSNHTHGPPLSYDQALALCQPLSQEALAALGRKARAHTDQIFGTQVYGRALVEFSNHCQRSCAYCGLRRDHRQLQRTRLSPAHILATAEKAHALGYGTLVLQSGEDPYWTQDRLSQLVHRIKTAFPDMALTLSVGVRPRAHYAAWKEAGADRFLLRHETADPAHFAFLHPDGQSLARRRQALWDLKDLGYVVGAGLMVGSPGQTPATLARDLLFLQDLQPQMVGIGPFLPQAQTPFGQAPAGSLDQTLQILALVRLLLPKALLPATTAMESLVPDGHIRALDVGANVLMPTLSPPGMRTAYAIYDHKATTPGDSAQGLKDLRCRLAEAGYTLSLDRGDPPQ